MKRDLDLVRSILEAIEAIPPGPPIHSFTMREAQDPMLVMGHVELMCESGLLDGTCSPLHQRVRIKGLTWAGHDFLDASRNQDVWDKTKDRLRQAGSWTFSLVLEVLKDEAKKRLSGLLPD